MGTRIKLWDSGNADKALGLLVDQISHADPRIAQKAAAIVLSKTLPESRFLESWQEKGKEIAEELESVKSWLTWKRQQDVAEPEEKDLVSESETENTTR